MAGRTPLREVAAPSPGVLQQVVHRRGWADERGRGSLAGVVRCIGLDVFLGPLEWQQSQALTSGASERGQREKIRTSASPPADKEGVDGSQSAIGGRRERGKVHHPAASRTHLLHAVPLDNQLGSFKYLVDNTGPLEHLELGQTSFVPRRQLRGRLGRGGVEPQVGAADKV